MKEKQCLALFRNTRQVILADRQCREQAICVRVIPVPTAISSECGMCLEINCNQKEQLEALMSKLELDIKIYARDEI